MSKFRELSYPIIFSKALVFSLIGIFLAFFLFRGETSLVSLFLTCLSLLWTAHMLFERSRRETWEKIITPFQANKKLAVALLCIFFGVMLGYGLFVIFTKISISRELLSRQLGVYKEIKVSIQDINFGNFREIIANNVAVLFIVLFIALIYRLGGVMLVIAWNASVWGAVFFYVIKIGAGSVQMNPVSYFLLVILCIFPHLFTEAVGYVLCSMSGFFLSKGILKYGFSSGEFFIVLRSALILFAASIGFIVLSAFLESNLTPRLISVFFR